MIYQNLIDLQAVINLRDSLIAHVSVQCEKALIVIQVSCLHFFLNYSSLERVLWVSLHCLCSVGRC